jgi:hypothetical protein
MRAANPALVAAAIVFLAGCGGTRSPPVANVGTTAAAASTTGAAAPSESQLQQAALKYSRCMRASGVPDFPDPQTGGGFVFQAGANLNPSSPAFEAAQAKCRKLMPGLGLAPGSTTHPSAQWLAHMVSVADCMRRHGVTAFPDPKTSVPSDPFQTGSRAGVISNIDGVILVFPSSIDTQSPSFTKAAAACGFPLHNH